MVPPETESTTGTPASMDDADRVVVVSFRAPESNPDEESSWWIADSDWLAENMNDEYYRLYLRRAHTGPVSVGDEWAEFVNCGCASPEDVLLRVERVEGGTDIGPETAIEVVSRKSVVEEEGLGADTDE
jgi:hypothetical protein